MKQHTYTRLGLTPNIPITHAGTPNYMCEFAEYVMQSANQNYIFEFTRSNVFSMTPEFRDNLAALSSSHRSVGASISRFSKDLNTQLVHADLGKGFRTIGEQLQDLTWSRELGEELNNIGNAVKPFALAMPNLKPLSIELPKLHMPNISFGSRNTLTLLNVGKRQRGRPEGTGYEKYDRPFIQIAVDMISKGKLKTANAAANWLLDEYGFTSRVDEKKFCLFGSQPSSIATRLRKSIRSELKIIDS